MTKEAQESILHGAQYPVYLGSKNAHPKHSPYEGLSGTLMMSNNCRVDCASESRLTK